MKTSLNYPLLVRGLPLLVCLALHPLAAYSQTPNPPGQISYQGFLTDANGIPLATNTPMNYDVIFRLYVVPSGGNALWGEIQTVTVDRGYFSVLLGQGASDSTDPWTNNLVGFFTGANASDRYVGITVKGITSPDTEIVPRLRLLASPYAFLAANANALVSSSGQELITTANGFVGINKTNVNPVSALDVSGTVTATSLNVSGTVTAASLAAGNFSGSPTFSGTPVFNTGFGVANGATVSGNMSFSGSPTFNGGFAVGGGSIHLGDNPLYLRSGNDANHGLVYGGNGGTPWNIVDGPFLFGFSGGVLGTFGPLRQVLNWDSTGRVGIGTRDEVLGPAMLSIRGIYSGTPSQLQFEIYNPLGNEGSLAIGTLDNGEGMIQAYQYGLVGGNLLLNRNGGNVGVDMDQPQYNLDVNGSIHASGELFVNGYVGIGTTSPLAPLDVEAAATFNSGHWAYYALNGSSQNIGYFSGSSPASVSIYAQGRVQAVEFDAVSDARIKEVVGPSSGRQDLATILRLRVTDYRPVDKVVEGNGLKKGFIAQEVEAVIPEAVTVRTNFVPDVYALASATKWNATNRTLSLTMPKAHGLKAGDRVRLYADESTLELAVAAAPSAQELVLAECDKDVRHVFVLGKQVPDFRTVNYDRIFTTGIGAIQELARRVELLETREARLAELEQKAARVGDLEREVADLKKMVAQLAEAGRESRQAALATPPNLLATADASLRRVSGSNDR